MQYVHGGDIYTNENVIDFSANINLLGMPQNVINAAKAAIEASICYPDYKCRKLKSKLVEFFEYGNILEKNIICGNGAADIIFLLVNTLKPKKALLFAPSFAEYEQALKSTGCDMEFFYLKEENNFLLTKQDMHKVLEMAAKCDIVFLCNPNNPTGTLIKPRDLDGLIEECESNDTMLVIDECFNLFLENNEEYSVLDKISKYKNLFILNAFTKIFAMPGLRLGFGFSSNIALLEKMESFSQPWRVSMPAQEAGIASVNEKEYIIKSKEQISAERKYLEKKLKEMGFKVFDSYANYIFFKGKKGLKEELLRHGILIRSCENYRGLNDEYYRIAIREHKNNKILTDTLEEIKWQRS